MEVFCSILVTARLLVKTEAFKPSETLWKSVWRPDWEHNGTNVHVLHVDDGWNRWNLQCCNVNECTLCPVHVKHCLQCCNN